MCGRPVPSSVQIGPKKPHRPVQLYRIRRRVYSAKRIRCCPNHSLPPAAFRQVRASPIRCTSSILLDSHRAGCSTAPGLLRRRYFKQEFESESLRKGRTSVISAGVPDPGSENDKKHDRSDDHTVCAVLSRAPNAGAISMLQKRQCGKESLGWRAR